MNTIIRTFLGITLIAMCSCNSKPKKAATDTPEKKEVAREETQPSKAEQLVADAIKAHGGELYDIAHYEFMFRDKRYTFKNSKNRSRYTVSSIENTHKIHDVLENGKLTRTVNGKVVNLSKKDDDKHTEALNSVIYFATLPHKLKDKAVNKTYEGRATIKGQDYELVHVNFDHENGGTDYDDKFLYWINTDIKTIDYLAYSYSTDNGGVRFRCAINPRTVSGIRFQDYINYEVPIGTPLKDLSGIYEKGALKELSQIINEEIRELN